MNLWEIFDSFDSTSSHCNSLIYCKCKSVIWLLAIKDILFNKMIIVWENFSRFKKMQRITKLSEIKELKLQTLVKDWSIKCGYYLKNLSNCLYITTGHPNSARIQPDKSCKMVSQVVITFVVLSILITSHDSSHDPSRLSNFSRSDFQIIHDFVRTDPIHNQLALTFPKISLILQNVPKQMENAWTYPSLTSLAGSFRDPRPQPEPQIQT